MLSNAEYWSLIAVAGVVAMVAVAALARWVGVSAPLVLVVVGIGLSWLPGVPKLEVDPNVILAGVLPLVLYASALRMPAVDLRRDITAIGLLAVVLVAATTLAVGLLVDAVWPQLGLAGSFALAAAVGPTDALAATAVGMRLGLPSRLLVIIEGEGLINDASALVLLRSAVAAVAVSVSALHVVGDFFYAVGAAVAIGLVVAHVAVFLRKVLHDAVLTTAVSLTVPFVAFVPTEVAGASGVLAVVTAGVVSGYYDPQVMRASDRLAETVNWQTISFLLESGVFLLMGLQLRTLLDQVDEAHAGVSGAIGLGLLIALVALGLRMVFVGPLVGVLAVSSDRAVRLVPVLEEMREKVAGMAQVRRTRGVLRKIDRKSADVSFAATERLGWRAGLVLGWSGMRGAITVAAAESLPDTFPLRPQVLLAAFTAALAMLLVPGVSLPWVIEAAKVPGDDAEADQAQLEELVTMMSAAGRRELDELQARDAYPAAVLDLVRAEFGTRPDLPEESDQDPEGVKVREQYGAVSLQAMAASRRELLRARASGAYSTRVLKRVERHLDLTEGVMEQFAQIDD